MLTEVGGIAVNVVAEKRSTFSRALADVLLISVPELTHAPARFTRPDGTSTFGARGFEVYTTQALLDAEARLRDAGRRGMPRFDIRIVADVAVENLPGRAHACPPTKPWRSNRSPRPAACWTSSSDRQEPRPLDMLSSFMRDRGSLTLYARVRSVPG